MKTFIIFLLLLSIGCSTKETSILPVTLIGTWKLVNTTISNCSDPSLNTVTTACVNCSTITFTISEFSQSDGTAGIYSTTGNKITLTTPISTTVCIFSLTPVELTMTYSLQGNSTCQYTTKWIRQ